MFGDDERTPGSGFPGARVAGIRQCPALLRQHRNLIGGSQRARSGKAGLRYGDEFAGAVLERERADKRDAQRRVDRGVVPAGEHCFRASSRLRDLSCAQQRFDYLQRQEIGVAVTRW
jgi:hypothetical protein